MEYTILLKYRGKMISPNSIQNDKSLVVDNTIYNPYLISTTDTIKIGDTIYDRVNDHIWKVSSLSPKFLEMVNIGAIVKVVKNFEEINQTILEKIINKTLKNGDKLMSFK